MNEENNTNQTVGDELLTVESAISQRTQKIADLKNELKLQNEMLNSYLENDESYREVSEIAKKASQKKSAVKRELLSNPEAGDLPGKVKELRDELKEVSDALSYYLREYQRITGTSEIEDENGEMQQIVYTARLVKRSVFKK